MRKVKELTPDQIKRAVSAYRDGCSIKDVAIRFGTSEDFMSEILHRHTTIRKQWNRKASAA